jgi:hypothetical protein
LAVPIFDTNAISLESFQPQLSLYDMAGIANKKRMMAVLRCKGKKANLKIKMKRSYGN